MNDLKQRLLQFIEFQGVSVREFSKKAGISPAQLSSKALISAFSTDNLTKILTVYPNLSPDWLLTGSGSMLRSGGASSVSLVSSPCSCNTNTVINETEVVSALRQQLAQANLQLAKKDEQINKLLDLLNKKA